MDDPPGDEPCEIVVSAPDGEWLRKLGRECVEGRLAAAAYADQTSSFFRGNSAIESREETRLVLRTSQARVADITRRVESQHASGTPSVIVRPIVGGSKNYLKWIENETGRERGSPTPLTERVAKWLNSSGFPLEMRVARAVRALQPMQLRQESKYIDQITGVVRPVDVEAVWSDVVLPNDSEDQVYHAVTLAIECKAGPQPWVLLKDPEEVHVGEIPIVSSLYHLPKKYSAAVGADWERAFEEEVYEQDVPILGGDFLACYAMQQMKGTRSDDDDKNDAYDALRQAASGALGLLSQLDSDSLPAENNFVIPILVTTHPLLVGSLSDSDEVEVEYVDRGAVAVRIAGGLGMDSNVLVHVVSEAALPSFLTKCKDLVNFLLNFRPQGPQPSWPLGKPMQ